MKKISFVIALAFVFAIGAIEASAQSKVNVRFARGASSVTVSGSIRGERYIDYVLKASGGQFLTVVLTKRSGAPALFNILPLGSEVAISDDARQSTNWTGELPNDGTYVVRVYMEKGDRQNGRSSSYRISFRIR